MKLIVGLGNPGEQYESTRHNLGYMVLDHFYKDFSSVTNSVWSNDTKLKSDTAVIDWQPEQGPSEKIILAKPTTYMNNSGMGVQLIASYYKIDPGDIWVLHDELDLPLGKMKIRFGGAAAGHHGVEDIMQRLGTDKFWRFRLGIGEIKHTAGQLHEDGKVEKTIARRLQDNASDFVLGVFSSSEKSETKKLIKYGSEALEVALEKGMETAMNRFNTK
jgi:peptidyl-tRNA hydrolase, PTH1 family